MEPDTGRATSAVELVRKWDALAILQLIEFRGETTLVVSRENLRRVCEFLFSDPQLHFTFLSDITPVDRFPLEPRFEINYQLLSLERKERLRIQVKLPGNDPLIHSLTPLWPTANWHEREAFDLFGIRFDGHPELTRILMPDDWEGHPLRKDYPTEGYR